jgi:hypothetical protein
MLQFFAEPSLVQWQQHILVLDRPFPARLQEVYPPFQPPFSSCGDAGREWAAGGAGRAAAILQRLIDAAAAEGRLRPEETAAAAGALAVLLEGYLACPVRQPLSPLSKLACGSQAGWQSGGTAGVRRTAGPVSHCFQTKSPRLV